MLTLMSLTRAAWAKLQTAHPAVRWGSAVLVALVALELIGEEALNLYIKIATAPATIEQTKAQAINTAMESWRLCLRTLVVQRGVQDPPLAPDDPACDKYHPFPEVHALQREKEKGPGEQLTANGKTPFRTCFEKEKNTENYVDAAPRSLIMHCLGENIIISTSASAGELEACYEEIRPQLTSAISDDEIQKGCLSARAWRTPALFAHHVETSKGRMLAGPKGMTLYAYDRDTTLDKSACNGECAVNWPPLFAADDAKASNDWKDNWSIAVRDDGKKQWAYNGNPLYYWKGDKKPGDIDGNNRNGMHLVPLR